MSDDTEWFYMQGADRQGPVSVDILKARLRNKDLKDSTLVWTERFGDDWKRLDEVLGNVPNVQPASSNDDFNKPEASSEDWYYVERGERKGPLDAKALQSIFERGLIDENTRVWTEGFGEDWKPIHQVSALRGAGQPPLVPSSEISNVWLYLLISVPVVMAVVEAIWLEVSTTKSAGGAVGLGFFLFFIPNTICALLDQRAVERSGRKDAVKGLLFWIVILVPVYIFLRSKRTGLGVWPGFAWIGAVVASVFVSDMLPRSMYLGLGVPTCESRSTIAMIEQIYPTIPVNISRSTVIDISDVRETILSNSGAVRECSATVRNSSGLDTPIIYSISERGDDFYYEVRLSGF